jgi:putative lipoic acid-binding regulatory protein
LLASQHTFPCGYTHKFIGKNTVAFTTAVERLEGRFGALRLEKARESKGGAHIALTYVFAALDPDDIIALFEETAKLPDLHIIL